MYSFGNLCKSKRKTGQFFWLIQQKNCLQNVDNKTKAAITDRDAEVNKKQKDPFNYSNIANFIFISNEQETLKIEIDNGCYLILDVSGEKRKNKEYYANLVESTKSLKFNVNSIIYFLIQKVYSIRKITIPFTEAKERIINVCSGYFETLISIHEDIFVQKTHYQCMFKVKNHIKTFYQQEFNRKIKRFCNRKRIGLVTNRVYIFILNKEQKE